MSQLKKSIKKNVLNEADMFVRIRQEAFQKERKMKMRKKLWISGSIAAALLIAIVSVWSNLIPAIPNSTGSLTTASLAESTTKVDQKQVYAMVSVDINPSLELYTNKEGLVVDVKTRNKDAEALEINDLVGQPADASVVNLIKRAAAAGFIKSGDSADDYVVVSTVVLDENDADAKQNQDSLGYKIQLAVAAADLNSTTKVAVIKATLQEKFAADGKKIPLGLYIINGMIEKDGTMISVSEFVKNKNNVKKLAKRAEIIAAKDARKD